MWFIHLLNITCNADICVLLRYTDEVTYHNDDILFIITKPNINHQLY